MKHTASTTRRRIMPLLNIEEEALVYIVKTVVRVVVPGNFGMDHQFLHFNVLNIVVARDIFNLSWLLFGAWRVVKSLEKILGVVG